MGFFVFELAEAGIQYLGFGTYAECQRVLETFQSADFNFTCAEVEPIDEQVDLFTPMADWLR